MSAAVAQDRTWKECELADHDPDRSIAACSKLLNRPGVRAAAFQNRGLAWAAKGNLDQAASTSAKEFGLTRNVPTVGKTGAKFISVRVRYQQAIADISEAIRIDPVARTFRFHSRAAAYRGLGDIAHAIADFDEAIRLDPVARSFRFHDLGNALRDAGQYDRALATYDTALRLERTKRMDDTARPRAC